jgi:hypothetical protein
MTQTSPRRPAHLSVLVDRWVRAGIISPAQAERIRAEEGVPPLGLVTPPPVPGPGHQERTSLVIEALGYLGGVVILVATGLLAAQYWTDLTTFAQLALVATAALLLLAAGFAVPERLGAVGQRLHAVLWFLAVGASAGFFALLGRKSLHWSAPDVLLLTGSAALGIAAVLWWRHRTVLQQLAVFVAFLITAAAAAAQLGTSAELPGVAVWGAAAVWFLLGWGGLVEPRQFAFVLGAIGLIIGAALTMSSDAGITLALATVAALVAVGVLFRDLVLLGVSAYGALQTLPTAINEWFPGQLAAPLALLVVGALLVTAAVYTARQRRAATAQARRPGRDFSVGPSRTATVAASVVALAVTAVVLGIGLT